MAGIDEYVWTITTLGELEVQAVYKTIRIAYRTLVEHQESASESQSNEGGATGGMNSGDEWRRIRRCYGARSARVIHSPGSREEPDADDAADLQPNEDDDDLNNFDKTDYDIVAGQLSQENEAKLDTMWLEFLGNVKIFARDVRKTPRYILDSILEKKEKMSREGSLWNKFLMCYADQEPYRQGKSPYLCGCFYTA